MSISGCVTGVGRTVSETVEGVWVALEFLDGAEFGRADVIFRGVLVLARKQRLRERGGVDCWLSLDRVDDFGRGSILVKRSSAISWPYARGGRISGCEHDSMFGLEGAWFRSW
jgi:hypothetical protein